ncbi:hypothetical protein [Rhodococcus jostii]
MTTSTMNRLQRLRKLAYAPLVAAVAAGAICTGAGIGTAAPTAADTTAPATTDTPQSGDAFNWTLQNHTGQTIYGDWGAWMEWSGNSSHVEAPADNPWHPDEAATAVMYRNMWHETRWSGHICYNKHWWDYAGWPAPRDQDAHNFSLEADSTGALFVYFTDHDMRRYRVAMTLQPGDC